MKYNPNLRLRMHRALKYRQAQEPPIADLRKDPKASGQVLTARWAAKLCFGIVQNFGKLALEWMTTCSRFEGYVTGRPLLGLLNLT